MVALSDQQRWIAVAAAAMAVLAFGLGGVLKLLLCVVVMMAGGGFAVYAVATSETMGRLIGLLTESRQRGATAQTLSLSETTHISAAAEYPLTGNARIDEQLHDILGYVFRDYVYAWQFKVTHSTQFSRELQETLQVVIASLSEKIKAVDWMPYLTTRLVDDVACHVRLFKNARLQSANSRASASGEGVGLRQADLESFFFDAEVTMEGHAFCRDLVCTVHQEEIRYLEDIAELLLFLVLPKTAFNVHIMRTIAREIISQVLLKPTLDLVSDPDFINQTIVWLYRDQPVKPDMFTSTLLRTSESVPELQAARDLATASIGDLRSNDSRGDVDSSLKQQLSTLLQLREAIDARIRRLQQGDAHEDESSAMAAASGLQFPAQIDWNQMVGPGLKLFDLPIEVVLRNNLCLSFFVDYMQSIGCQAYVFFYLNIEGWKVSAEQQLSTLDLEACQEKSLVSSGKTWEEHRDSVLDNMREAAQSIYEEYLSDNANPRLRFEDESATKRFLFKLRTERVSSDWFSEVQNATLRKLESDERFYGAFQRSLGYVKLLAELDLLRDARSSSDSGPCGLAATDDNIDAQSLTDADELSIYDTLSLNSLDSEGSRSKCGSSLNLDGSPGHEADDDLNETVTEQQGVNAAAVRAHKRIGSDTSLTIRGHKRNSSHGSLFGTETTNAPVLAATIKSVQSIREGGKQFAVYKILVTSRDVRGHETCYDVIRRYSDFYALQQRIAAKFPQLASLPFPSKKTFGNLDRHVLDTRMKMLQGYLQALLDTTMLQENPDLLDILRRFLNQTSYEAERSQAPSNVAKAVGSVRRSVRSVSMAVTSVPGQLLHKVDSAVDGLSKILLPTKDVPAAVLNYKVGSSLDVDAATVDNIPLRVVLLLMDEVFDLRERNQWLRRQIVAVLRQIIKAMFGDIVNRRIVDYFTQMTSASTIAHSLSSLKENLWPNGYPAESAAPRVESVKLCTRTAAKVAMLSSLSDDLRRVIGSETSRAGLLTLFGMLQYPVLNKRLLLVVLEGVLDTIFSEHDLPNLYSKLHSRSGRVRNDLRNSQRTHADLRR